MKQLLARDDIQLTKSLGQNFLHDGNQLQRIVDAAALTREDKVLEIGPGLGPLTELLIAKAGEVLAIEKDARLCAVLRERFQASPGFTLIHDDALDLLKRGGRDWGAWKLVANLPYSVASPILVELAQARPGPERLVATLQLEVARRLMAGADEDDYGVLTLLVRLHYQPDGSFKIPATCFFPPPEVESSCICLVRRAEPLLSPAEEKLFVRIVKRSFSQRRKMMLKLLKSEWDAAVLAAAFERLNLSPQVRAEKLELEQFVALTRELNREA
jgi:16S rRNA (adenine1518-N6/adenine1519-N6)-dimethyltransferase